ncbi:unnamed protein product [Bemisia tabaci]|uniref:Probable tRNA(His) guanylyltransferase n=1 Tax=Bemisia tabaci TaxID=7038 RepID=A0A9N9ZW87_BEMTA|nr:unnamed protein product [Bemisia tabaci]
MKVLSLFAGTLSKVVHGANSPLRNFSSSVMAKSKFEYVKGFEEDRKCLPNCWIVVRIDGRSFTRFSDVHKFEKPNDRRALELMTRAASYVMEELKEISLAFGTSDEYSFIFRKDAQLYNRRRDKIMSTVNSLFSSAFVFHWTSFFGFVKLLYPPAFDARVVLYPTDANLRDYLSWRQADVHINNLYNTAFWTLVKKGNLTPQQAQERLKNTLASHKNEILFKEFDINYNNEPPLFRKGTTLVRKLVQTPPDNKLKQFIIPLNVDIIGEEFWKENPEIIGMKSIQIYSKKGDEVGYMVSSKLPTTHENIEPTVPQNQEPSSA